MMMKRKANILLMFLLWSSIYLLAQTTQRFSLDRGGIKCDVEVEYFYRFIQDDQVVKDLSNLDGQKDLGIDLIVRKVNIYGKSKDDVEIRFPAKDYSVKDDYPEGLRPKSTTPIVLNNERDNGSLHFEYDGNSEIRNRAITIPIWLTTKSGAENLTFFKAKSEIFSMIRKEPTIAKVEPLAEKKGGVHLTPLTPTQVLPRIEKTPTQPSKSTELVTRTRTAARQKQKEEQSIQNEWQKVKSQDCSAIISFINKYSVSNYKEVYIAKSLLNNNFKPSVKYEREKENKNFFKITVQNSCNSQIELSGAGIIEKISNSEFRLTGISTLTTITATTTDGRSGSIEIDPTLEALNAQLLVKGESMALIYDLEGGNSNYSIELQDENGALVKSFNPNPGEDTLRIKCSELNLANSNYSVILTDSRKNESKELGSITITKSPLSKTAIVFFSVLLLLLIGYLVYNSYNKWKQELQPSEEYLKKMKHNIKISSKTNDNVEANLQEEEPTVPNNNQLNPIQIKINRKTPIKNESSDQSYSLEQRWEQVSYIPEIVQRNPALYFPCALANSQWKDTTISDIFIHERFAIRLNDFVFDDKRRLSLFRGQEIPEIGGFILGKVDKNEHQGKIRYQVILERFVDIEPESNNQYQIEFGPAAWSELVRSMDDVYKDQEYLLLGWFHTHPGHGLFLSQPDQNIHLTYFKEKYHIALELDSVLNERNPNFEFGIFTWKNDQTMNNAKDHLGSWFNWNEVRTWLKTNSKENLNRS